MTGKNEMSWLFGTKSLRKDKLEFKGPLNFKLPNISSQYGRKLQNLIADMLSSDEGKRPTP